jgi:hypothetical protein
VRKLERKGQSEFEIFAFLIQAEVVPEARKNQMLENKEYETYTRLRTEGINFNSKGKKVEE